MTRGAPTGSPRWGLGLDVDQRSAVEHDGGPLLVVAGAGTGKTRMLVSRLARLIDQGVSPDRILLVTFSRRAAEEMIRRLSELTDAAVARQVHAGTFHSVAHRLLRQHGAAVGLDDGFTVLDQADAGELMHLVRAEALAGNTDGSGTALPPGVPKRRFPRKETLTAIYSRVVNTQVPLDEAVTRWFPWCRLEIAEIREVFRAYTSRKRAQGLLDFDDLLLHWRAAAEDERLGPILASRYDHVLVDEYQDTNVLQSDILRALRRDDGRITVVGDDSQAIYSFRAASVRNILDFSDHFPGSRQVTMTRNYRSTQPILDLANAVLSGAAEGFAKDLWTARSQGGKPTVATCADERSQAGAVCEVILEHYERGMPLREQAVLFRTGHHSDLLEVELRRRNLPFVKYGGLRFLEAGHVRDLLALLRLLENPWDELAWSRVLQLLDGVGPATTHRVIEQLGVWSPDRAGGDPLTRFLGPDRPPIPRAGESVGGLVSALSDCSRPGTEVGVQVDRLVDALAPLLIRRYERVEPRMRDLEQLAHLACGYPSRDRLLADLTLDPPASTGDFAGVPLLDDDYLILSTVHSAKGGEWTAVHLIHAADGMFPSDMATGDSDGIDEERRLFYVALTRAREHLHLYAPLRYHHSGPAGWADRHGYAQRTRFLPPEVDHLLDHRAVRGPLFDDALDAAVPVTSRVDQVLDALW